MCGVYVLACVLAGWVPGLTTENDKAGPVEYVMGGLAVYPQGSTLTHMLWGAWPNSNQMALSSVARGAAELHS